MPGIPWHACSHAAIQRTSPESSSLPLPRFFCLAHSPQNPLLGSAREVQHGRIEERQLQLLADFRGRIVLCCGRMKIRTEKQIGFCFENLERNLLHCLDIHMVTSLLRDR